MGFQDVLIVPNGEICDTVKHIKRNLLTKFDNKDEALNLKSLISLAESDFFKQHGYLHEFLENSEMHFTTPSPEPRNSELEARVQKLKAQQENEEYRTMTKGLMQTEKNRTFLKDDVKQVTSQITAVINFVFTVAGSFFFMYKAVEYALPERNIPAQVLMGIFTASVVALADLYFLAKTI